MFEQLITIGEMLISGLKSLRLKKDKKRSLGKHLSSLHRDLSILLENGDKILKLFEQHNKGKRVDIEEIKKYLLEQHVLIPRLAKVLRKRNIQTILSIQAPAITPLHNNSINHSRKQLRKIQSLTEELRKYIVEHFEINEII